MRCSMFSHTKSLKSIVQIYSTSLFGLATSEMLKLPVDGGL